MSINESINRLFRNQLLGLRNEQNKFNSQSSLLNPQSFTSLLTISYSLTFILIIIFFATFPSHAQSVQNSKVSLFTKTGTGEYYTLYPNGIKKEDAYIGGFKSLQLDPVEANIYFYDPLLKVIGKINLENNLVSKVIGKPKSSTITNYQTPVKFSDSSLSKLIDFTIDKYGNLFILDSQDTPTNQNPRILKASLKDGTIQEAIKINDYFKRAFSSQYLYDVNFTINNLTYNNNDGFIYLYGNATYSDISPFSIGVTKGAVVLRFEPQTNTIEFFGGNNRSIDLGYNTKINFDDSRLATINGLIFDNENNIYISGFDLTNNPVTYKEIFSNGSYTHEQYIGDGTGSITDIGDGGLAKSAYAKPIGTKSLCQDNNGDVFIADSINNSIRKILKENGLIITVAGSGKELINFNELKDLKTISLQAPSTLFTDKYNNLYIGEQNRILQIKNFIQRSNKPIEQIKIANLEITKIGDREVVNPKGNTSTPDLTLDYSYSGDQNIEVSTKNIPEGTNIKLLSINNDNSTTQTLANGKVANTKALIPIKIEAGTTKVIKAETDPFIPAPGVYLADTAPKIEPSQYLPELQISKINRDTVNQTGNLLPLSTRFNFSNTGWQRYQNIGEIKLNAVNDPDNLISDGTYIDFGSRQNTIWLDNQGVTDKKLIFSVWMRTDSGTVNVPFGIGPACPDLNRNQSYYWTSWVGCNYPYWISYNQLSSLPLLSYSTLAVTPAWQKFSITSNSNLDGYNKLLFIGGLNYTTNQKVYLWGARLEAIQ